MKRGEVRLVGSQSSSLNEWITKENVGGEVAMVWFSKRADGIALEPG